MSHGRFQNPFQATLTGLKDLFGRQPLADRLTDDLRIDGRTCLVTGASSGLGLAIATELARRGGRVLMVSRSRIPQAGDEVRRASGSTTVEQIRTDLSDLQQVHALADQLRDRAEAIDVLVDNAGVATPRARRTAQGLDAMFVTNFLSKVLLAHRLLRDGTVPNRTFLGGPSRRPPSASEAILGGPSRRPPSASEAFADARPDAPRPRIIYVSSDSHRGASAIDWPELGTYYDHGVNKAIHNYSYFKLVLNTFAVELSRRLRASDAEGGELDVPVHVMCPGPVDSEIARDAPPALAVFMKAMFKLFFRAPAVAAGPAVYMSVAPEYGERTAAYLHMWNPKRMDDKCYDAEAGARLWAHAAALLREHDAWPWDDA